MFDLTSERTGRPFHERKPLPTIVSVVGHGVVVLALVTLPRVVTERLPLAPTMMAYVTAAPLIPPPPPPPPPAVSARRAATRAQPASGPGAFTAPIEAPLDIRSEPADAEDSEGVEGGVEGGMVGGALGGMVGGLTAAPLPPPPAPPALRAPVRVGGGVQAPALLYRVDPSYSELAMRAGVEGIVILEANVNIDGCVESVRVLHSVKFLDDSAIAAVRQWRYKPLALNGERMPFVLTVTVSFTIERD